MHMEQHNKIVNELQAEFEEKPHVLAMLVTGSFARGEAVEGNDLDVLLVVDGEKIRREYKVGNILVELGSLTLPHSLNQIEESPMFVYMYLDAKAIFDKGNYLQKFQQKAQEVLNDYTPPEQEKKEVKKWLESVIDKIATAEKKNDQEKISFAVATNLWKTVEGIYIINSVPTPAFTSALRRIKTLKVMPENFDALWNKILFGDLEERKNSLVILIKFVLGNLSSK